MTEKLYDLDSYLWEFECKVTSLYKDGDDLIIETDRTAFFPEGGGQTSDVGFLKNLYVKDVQNKCGKVLHIVENYEENVKKLQIGEVITGKIDEKKRFSDMQQHSGEHIFSGIVHNLYGYDNVGFHLGKEVVTLDFNGALNYDDVCKVESLVNEAVWANKEIKVFYPSDEELESIDYRSKKEINEALRIVEIPGVDICACCAPHVKRTGEIGIVEVVSFEKYKGGTRLSILCGERALKDIRRKLDENKRVSNLFSAKETETFKMAEKIKKDNAVLSYKLTGAKLENLRLKAERIEKGEKLIVFCDLEDTNAIREYADILSEKAAEYAAVFGGEEGNYKFVIISKTGYDVDALSKEMREKLNARGGGRNGIVQGSLAAEREAIEKLFESVKP